jgi:hypothetical protein
MAGPLARLDGSFFPTRSTEDFFSLAAESGPASALLQVSSLEDASALLRWSPAPWGQRGRPCSMRAAAPCSMGAATRRSPHASVAEKESLFEIQSKNLSLRKVKDILVSSGVKNNQDAHQVVSRNHLPKHMLKTLTVAHV